MKLLFLLGLICWAKGSPLSGRLINGQTASETDKFAVRVLSFEYEGQTTARLASGVAISTNYVLTVAQVLYGFEFWYIGYGSIHVDSQSYQRTNNVLIHPEYIPASLSNNIGVIRLDYSVGSDGFIQIASAPPEIPVMQALGYGIIDSDTNAVATTLQQLILVELDSVCETQYQGINISLVICAVFPIGSDFGYGDQGGPITNVVKNELHGLVSFWSYEIDYQMVGVNISFYNEFITNAIALLA